MVVRNAMFDPQWQWPVLACLLGALLHYRYASRKPMWRDVAWSQGPVCGSHGLWQQAMASRLGCGRCILLTWPR